MPKFVTHEPLAAGILNSGHTTGVGNYAAWSAELTNSEPILSLCIQRMQEDWLALTGRMRKPYGAKEVAARF